MSNALPTDFPYHPHWKMDECHIAYWELYPTVDHVVPLGRGGSDGETNLACTPMLSNGAKANWTLEELGWQVLPPGDIRRWDGLVRWFLEYTEEHQEALEDPLVKRWHTTAVHMAI